MPEAAADSEKPLKPLRRYKPTEPLRQVHFHEASTKSSSKKQPAAAEETSTPPSNNNNNNQPQNHPQVGQPPLPHLNCPPSGQWFTAADPTRSVNLPGQPAAVFTTEAHQHPQQTFHQHPSFHSHPHQHAGGALPPFVTYIPPYAPAPLPNMGDYQNCMPPPTGVNFQPPVPDTTFGPIPHVYVPRFDTHGIPTVNHPGSLPMGQGGYFVQQPGFAPVPIAGHQQPVILNGQAYIPAGTPTPGIPGQPIFTTPVMATPAGVAGPPMGQPGTVPIISGNCGNTIPDVSGLGRTPNEEMLRQVEFAYNNRLFEPQEFKPADDDPSRFYYVREVDGNWTQRNRFTIDHMGDCRWYVTDEGWFYAVRLPD